MRFLLIWLLFPFLINAQVIVKKITLTTTGQSASGTTKKLTFTNGGTPSGVVRKVTLTHGITTSDKQFLFNLDSAYSTVAGVFDANQQLVKQIWYPKGMSAGSNFGIWDGIDQNGNLCPDGTYEIRILEYNITATWDGVLGNRSDSMSGSTKYHGFDFINSMSLAGVTLFSSLGYNEAYAPTIKTNTSTKGQKTFILPNSGSSASMFNVNDGVYVYWQMDDPFTIPSSKQMHFVFATSISNDAEVVFPSGIAYQMALAPKRISVIDTSTAKTAAITGLAVQKNGNYLFVSRSGVNQLHVVDKSTGAVVQNLTFTTPTALAVDTLDNLWMATGGIVKKFTVNPDGTLSAAVLTLSGIVDPLAIACSPDGTTVTVVDGSTSQQIKAFNTTSGASSWTFGQAGGYGSVATVSNDRFMFFKEDLTEKSFIFYQPDGSFWVNDMGNYRIMHFSSSRTFIENMGYVPRTYNVSVNRNDPTRVFIGFLEYAIDYTKTLDNGTNGSWTLVKNWRGTALQVSTYNPGTGSHLFSGVNTLSNGRTYSVIRQQGVTQILNVYELVSSGTLRFTGITYSTSGHGLIYPDGSFRQFIQNSIGGTIFWQSQALTGFDGSNNPIWGAVTNVASVPAVTGNNPVNWSDGRPGEETDDGVFVTFDHGLQVSGKGLLYHLGGVKAGDNKYYFQTARVTHNKYAGTYPSNGDYDVGNSVKNPGSDAVAVGNNIYWGYHGEFWKQAQVNKWQIVHSNGLFLWGFGAIGNATSSKIESQAQMAGNSFSFQVAMLNGDNYLYHCDEQYGAGAHRWTIRGANNVKEQKFPITHTGVNGISSTFMDGSDCNNMRVKVSRFDTTINFTNLNVGLAVSDTANYSAKFITYVQAGFSETTTFYIQSDKGVRVWIDSLLLIDQFANSTLTEYSATVSLVAGKRYRARVEKFNGGTLIFKWSSTSVTKAVVPTSKFYRPPVNAVPTYVDLMDGLNYYIPLINGQYGWTRNFAEDNTAKTTKIWNVNTAHSKYDRYSTPDLYFNFIQATTDVSGVYTVTRDLGTPIASTSWDVNATINFPSIYFNDLTKYGQYFEVLDSGSRVMARFYVSQNGVSTATTTATIFGNTKTIASDLITTLKLTTKNSGVLDIKGTVSGVTITYGSFAAQSDGLFDGTATWSRPKYIRMTFFSKTSSANVGRAFNLEGLNITVN